MVVKGVYGYRKHHQHLQQVHIGILAVAVQEKGVSYVVAGRCESSIVAELLEAFAANSAKKKMT